MRKKRPKKHKHLKQTNKNDQYKPVKSKILKQDAIVTTERILKKPNNSKKVVSTAHKKSGWFNKKGAVFVLLYLCNFLKPAGTWQMNRTLCRNGTMLEQHNQAILKNYWTLNSSYYGSVTEIPSLKKAKFALDYILNKNRFQGKMHYCDIDGQPHEVEISIDYSKQNASLCENSFNTEVEVMADAKLQSITLNPDGTLKHFKATVKEHHFDMDPNQCQSDCHGKQPNNFEDETREKVTVKICPIVRDTSTKTVLTCEPKESDRTNRHMYHTNWLRNNREISDELTEKKPDPFHTLNCFVNNSFVLKNTQLTISPSTSGSKDGLFKMFNDVYSCQLGIDIYNWYTLFDNVLVISVVNLPNPHANCDHNNMNEVINAPEINSHLIPSATILASAFALLVTAGLIYCWKIRTRVLAPGNPMQDADAGTIGSLMENSEL